MFKTILVPIDLAHEASQEALPHAAAMSKQGGGKVILVNVQVPAPPMVMQYLPADHVESADREAAELLKGLIGKYGLGESTEVRVRHGTVYHEVLEEAKESDADLIIIASHHPEISDYLLGSNAASVVRHADCSVLVLRT